MIPLPPGKEILNIKNWVTVSRTASHSLVEFRVADRSDQWTCIRRWQK
jgi:hypothetical protein